MREHQGIKAVSANRWPWKRAKLARNGTISSPGPC